MNKNIKADFDKVKREILNQYNIKAIFTHNSIDGVNVGVGNYFLLENEEENLLDFYYFCFDIVAGIVNKSLMLTNLPEIHKTFEEPIDEKYLIHEIDKYRNMLLLMIIEKNNHFNEIKKQDDNNNN